MDAKTLAENLHRVQEHLKYEVAQTARLRAALRELYEAAHDHLNAPDDAGWISEGTPRLNAALGRAFKTLHDQE